MQKIRVKIQRLSHFQGDLPKYESSGASGLDVRAALGDPWILRPGERILIPTGLAVEIPVGFEIQVRPRSGWAVKHGVTVINSPGTIDSDYRGELKVGLINLGTESVQINPGDRIAQIVLTPVAQLAWQEEDELSVSERGERGFGSTGSG